jgi:hypothetical protein
MTASLQDATTTIFTEEIARCVRKESFLITNFERIDPRKSIRSNGDAETVPDERK